MYCTLLEYWFSCILESSRDIGCHMSQAFDFLYATVHYALSHRAASPCSARPSKPPYRKAYTTYRIRWTLGSLAYLSHLEWEMACLILSLLPNIMKVLKVSPLTDPLPTWEIIWDQPSEQKKGNLFTIWMVMPPSHMMGPVTELSTCIP